MKHSLFLTLLALLLVSPGQAVTVSVPLNPGWNAVGIEGSPVSLLNAPSQVNGMAWLEGTSYHTGPLTASQAGLRRGFWVFANAATAFSYTASDTVASSLTLQPGWNLVAFPATRPVPGANLQCRIPGEGGPVALDQVLLPSFVEIQPDNRYVDVDVSTGGSLRPGRAYWVYALFAVTMSYGI